MAFLHAYIDDSATDMRDRRLFMAGYLTRADKWALFTEAWDEELRSPPSIEYLRMVEANNLRDQFKGWTEQARDEKLRGLARVIRHFEPFSFEFSISRELNDKILKPVSLRGLGNAHFSCCFSVVSGVARFAASQGIRAPIQFVFDQQEGVDKDIGLLFDMMKQHLPSQAQKLISGAPQFEDDKKLLPLQAADMLAWHIRREYEAGKSIQDPLPMADLLRCSDGHLVSEIPEAYIRTWAGHYKSVVPPRFRSKGRWQEIRREIGALSSLGLMPNRIGLWKRALWRLRTRLLLRRQK